MLALDNLSFHVKSRGNILNAISFEVKEGEFVGLVGPSGAGKTTLLRCLSGLIKPTSGRIILNGKDITKSPISKRSISFMQQGFPLYYHLSVWENTLVAVGGNKASDTTHQFALNLLETIGISKCLLEHRPENLSGGEAQRIALCKALLRPTNLLLLDEPFSNLDKTRRRNLGEMVRQRARELGQVVLFVSHDESNVLFLADRVCVIENGSVLQYDTLLQLSRAPAHKKVAAFALETGLQTVALKCLNKAQLASIQAYFGSLVNHATFVGWRPDSSVLVRQLNEKTDFQNSLLFPARIERQVPGTGGVFVQIYFVGLEMDYEVRVWHFEVEDFSEDEIHFLNLLIQLEHIWLLSQNGQVLNVPSARNF